MILITRPYDDAKRLAHMLGHNGVNSVISPVIKIVRKLHRDSPCGIGEINDIRTRIAAYSSAILTSPYAFYAMNMYSFEFEKVFAVGGRIKSLWPGYFYHKNSDLIVADDSKGLLQLLPNNLDQCIYLSGAHTSTDFQVEKLVCYEAVEQNSLSNEAIDAFKQNLIKGVALFSKRSADIFINLCSYHKLPLSCLKVYVISEQVKRFIENHGFKDIVVSESADDSSMVKSILRYSLL